MNNITETLPKGELIPRIPGNRFLQENWDPSSPIYGQSKSADIQKGMIVGWCPASKVFFEPKDDDRCLAVMLKNGRWCHMAYFCIVDGFDDPPMYDYFDYFNFEGLNRNIIDDYVTQKKWRL